jgi:hypothetical protein
LSIEAEPHTALPPRSFQALPMQAPQGWFAYLVPLVPLPLSLRVRSSYHEVLQALVRQLRADKNRSVFLELEELHKDNGIWQISRNASLWSPEMGLGVRVGHPSPRFWSWKLLSERALDDPFPPLMLSVMRLDAEESGCIHAVETMCGTGGLLQVLHSVPARQLLDAWMEALRSKKKAFALFLFMSLCCQGKRFAGVLQNNSRRGSARRTPTCEKAHRIWGSSFLQDGRWNVNWNWPGLTSRFCLSGERDAPEAPAAEAGRAGELRYIRQKGNSSGSSVC